MTLAAFIRPVPSLVGASLSPSLQETSAAARKAQPMRFAKCQGRRTCLPMAAPPTFFRAPVLVRGQGSQSRAMTADEHICELPHANPRGQGGTDAPARLFGDLQRASVPAADGSGVAGGGAATGRGDDRDGKYLSRSFSIGHSMSRAAIHDGRMTPAQTEALYRIQPTGCVVSNSMWARPCLARCPRRSRATDRSSKSTALSIRSVEPRDVQLAQDGLSDAGGRCPAFAPGRRCA